MRRVRWLAVAAALAVALVTGALCAGCPAAHSDYPTTSCKTDSDCYRGEKCINSSVCMPIGADLAQPPAAPRDLAGQTIDMTDLDGGTP
jgi:hypothetical protein